MSIFTDSTGDASARRVNEIDAERFDVENTNPDHHIDEDSSQYYWFGRKYFECVLAQNILQNSQPHESVAQVDSRLERAMRTFPYTQSLMNLRAEGLGPLLPTFEVDLEHDNYRAMMVCIGAVVRKGDRRQKAVMLAVLRQNDKRLQPSGFSVAQNGKTSSEGSGRGDLAKIERFVDEVNICLPNLGRYATALKFHTDKQGLALSFTVEEVSLVPPLFRAIAVVGGLPRYEGTAKTKKQARHEAAREACLHLNLEV